MLGRFIGLLAGCAMAALAVLIYDPTIIGPEAPVVSLGQFEVFRPAVIAAAALLGLCGFLAAFQPRPKKRKERAERSVLSMSDEPVPETKTDFGSSNFSMGGGSPSASPLW